MVPTWTRKPGKWESFFQSGNFEQTGNNGVILHRLLENEDILASFYFDFFSDFLIEVYLLNRFLYLLNLSNKTLRKYWKMGGKYWKNHGHLSVRKCGNHVVSVPVAYRTRT